MLSSEKPIWRGELYNCGVVLGTNALVVLKFKVFHSNGTEVPPQCEPGESQPSVSVTSVLQVTVEKNVCLGPGQTKTVCVRVNDNRDVIPLGVVTPSEAVLAELQCDFVEQLWQQGEATSHMRDTNWNNSSPVMIRKGTVVGTVEEVTPIDQGDPVWNEPEASSELVVRRCPIHPSKEVDSQARLRPLLCVGEGCSTEERESFLQYLLTRHHVFALSDSELGETDLVH